MSAIVRKVESDAEIAFRNNPTSPKAPRDVYIKVLTELTNSLESASTETKRSQIEADICDLYISRAAMEIRLKQKKQAKLVFDEALSREYCKKSYGKPTSLSILKKARWNQLVSILRKL